MSASSPTSDRETALAIWRAGLEAVRPGRLVSNHADEIRRFTDGAGRILAVGAGWGSLWRSSHTADVVVRRPADLATVLTAP